ncbi:MAG TPA: hypothetical protein DEB06_00940 [Phycisphaerales bacterium]|nr:hypothetical protein [Phycisphaerales bacterium]
MTKPRPRSGPLLLALVALAGAVSSCTKTIRVDGLPDSVVEDDTRRLIQAQSLAARAAREKDPAQAKRLYTQAVGTYRQLPAAWNNLGVLLMKDDQYLQAAEAFASAADLAPNDPRPYYNIGLLWDSRGYLRDARRFYIRALERDGSYLPALRGAIRADTLLNEPNDRTLGWLERSLMLEADPEWQEWMRLQKVRIESQPLFRTREQPE